MDFSTISGLISSVGFPIAACIYMAYLQNKSEERYRADIDKMRETVDNNTHIMIRICEKLDLEEKGKD